MTMVAEPAVTGERKASAEPKVSVMEFLRQLALFSGLTDAELQQLISMGQEVAVEPGDVLMREGDPGDSLYVIISGDVEVTKQSGSSEVVIARRGTGDVIGEMSLLDQAPRSATVRALTHGRMFTINQESFNNLLAGSPSAAPAILRTVTSRLRNTESMLRQSEKMAARGTLAAGVAHELNNPAAAARRAAEQLSKDLPESERLQTELDSLALSSEQRAALNELLDDARSRKASADLDPLALSDLENEVQDWLEAHNIDEAWEVAPRLVALGLDSARLDQLGSQLNRMQLSCILNWLAVRGSVDSLIDEIASSVGRISTIVKAIKSYSYLDQAPVQEIDVHEGLENTLVILRYKLKQGITVKKEYARDLPKIEAYASELNQVWTNIIDNAIDAMNGQGVLTIRTYEEGERVVVEICDNGPGIPPEIQARI